MEEIGEIVGINKSDAIVRIYRSSACGHCEMCGLSSDKKFIDIEVANKLHAQIGDKVQLKLQENVSLKVTAIVYLIPLFFALLLIGIGKLFSFPDWALIACFVLGLAVGFSIVRVIDKKYAKKKDFLPEMLQIINEEINKNE